MNGRHHTNLGCSAITVAIHTIIGEFILLTLDLLTEKRKVKK
jgi:hypothetical protein